MEPMSTMHVYAPWLLLAALGAYHGLNPAMGWLFAVSLGLQEQRRRAVLRAFGPIALGHALSIGLVVALVAAVRTIVAPDILTVVSALALIGFGLFKLLRPNSHPRWVGMRVNSRDLTVWSFLMATAHGAGLMLVPILFQLPADGDAHTAHAAHMPHAAQHAPDGLSAGLDFLSAAPLLDLAAVGLHTLTMFGVMAVIAIVVFEKLGLAILRQAWFNLDRIWAVSLLVTGVFALVPA